MEAEAPPEVRQEAEEALVTEDEGLLGGEEEEGSVRGEGVEGVILISQNLALVGEDHIDHAWRCGKRRFVCGKIPERKSIQLKILSRTNGRPFMCKYSSVQN